MTPKSILRRVGQLSSALRKQAHHPRDAFEKFRHIDAELRGQRFEHEFLVSPEGLERTDYTDKNDPLHQYFDAHLEGPGVYKWLHYFEIYHRHLAKFVDRDVTILEIGIYSGGSLGMWRSYLGPQSKVIGLDVEPACKSYENEYTTILIGDQEDRSFWRKFWADSPTVDVIIDDGGHTPSQQMVTLEECLPHLRPGGVFICEDVHHRDNEFNSFIAGMISDQNSLRSWDNDDDQSGSGQLGASTPVTPFQSHIHSIHCYPFVLAIEKRERPFTHLTTIRHGTQWQPHHP